MGNHLVVLDEVPGLRGDGGVGPHDVVGHDRPAAEEGEAPWRAQHAAHDVLGGLLEPVADGVLEHLRGNEWCKTRKGSFHCTELRRDF